MNWIFYLISSISVGVPRFSREFETENDYNYDIVLVIATLLGSRVPLVRAAVCQFRDSKFAIDPIT